MPISRIRLHIMSVLTQLNVEMLEIRGGFHCQVTTPRGGKDSGDQTTGQQHSNSFSSYDSAGNKTETGLVKAPFYGILDELPQKISVASFSILIVKMPLISLHGIQVERINGSEWVYNARESQILHALRLWFDLQ